MSLSYYVVSDGTTLAQTSTVIARIRALTPPAESQEKIDVTSLDNEEFKTYLLAALKDVDDVTVTLGMRDALGLSKTNQAHTITFPDGSTCVFWGQVSKTAPSQLTSKTEALWDVTISVLNLNATEVETGPVWTKATGA